MESSGSKVIWALAGCVGLLTLALCVGGGLALLAVSGEHAPPVGPTGPTGPTPVPIPVPDPSTGPVDLSARQVVAQVTSVTGSAPVVNGAECRFSVTGRPREGGGYWCNAQIVCAGRLMYGGANAGFFSCTLSGSPGRHVSGSDQNTTAQDSDSAMHLDTAAGSLSIRDDATGTYGAFTMDARVVSVN